MTWPRFMCVSVRYLGVETKYPSVCVRVCAGHHPSSSWAISNCFYLAAAIGACIYKTALHPQTRCRAEQSRAQETRVEQSMQDSHCSSQKWGAVTNNSSVCERGKCVYVSVVHLHLNLSENTVLLHKLFFMWWGQEVIWLQVNHGWWSSEISIANHAY